MSRNFAAVYLASSSRAELVCQELEDSGIHAQVAANSEELYQLLNYRPVDVVVLENELPGFLTGLDILEKVFQDLLRPSTVLLAKPTGEIKTKAQTLGIDAVLPPDASFSLIRDAVARLYTGDQVSQVLIPPEARRIVQRFDVIQPLPQLLVKVAGYLDSAEISNHALADDISTDPKATAELLKLANSSATGLQRKVANVFDAIKYLGSRQTVSLLLSHSLLNNQRSIANSTPVSERMWYHHRSVLIGSTASLFSQRFEEISPATASVLGLLQDIGILVMAAAFPKNYLQLIRRFRSIGQLRLEMMETQEFGYHHAHVSAAVLQKWGLPASMVSLVLNHHESDWSNKPNIEQRFLHVMNVGEAFANLTDGHVPQRYPLLQQRLLAYGDGSAEDAKSCLAESVAKALQSNQIFSLPVPDTRKLQQLVERIHSNDMPTELESVEDEPANGHAEPSRPKVLVIDDEPLIGDLLSRYLQQIDLDAIVCDRWSLASKHVNDAIAVLVDVHLREESGVQITQSLRSDGFTGPIIVVSGDRTRETVGRCLIAGATDYLTKPIDDELLHAKLRRHLGLSN